MRNKSRLAKLQKQLKGSSGSQGFTLAFIEPESQDKPGGPWKVWGNLWNGKDGRDSVYRRVEKSGFESMEAACQWFEAKYPQSKAIITDIPLPE